MTFKVILGQGQGGEMISVPYRDYFLNSSTCQTAERIFTFDGSNDTDQTHQILKPSYIETTALIVTQCCIMIKTTKYSSWVVQANPRWRMSESKVGNHRQQQTIVLRKLSLAVTRAPRPYPADVFLAAPSRLLAELLGR